MGEIGASDDLERCCLEFGQRDGFSSWPLPGGGLADAILEHYHKLGMKPVASPPLRFDKPAYVFVCKRG